MTALVDAVSAQLDSGGAAAPCAGRWRLSRGSMASAATTAPSRMQRRRWRRRWRRRQPSWRPQRLRLRLRRGLLRPQSWRLRPPLGCGVSGGAGLADAAQLVVAASHHRQWWCSALERRSFPGGRCGAAPHGGVFVGVRCRAGVAPADPHSEAHATVRSTTSCRATSDRSAIFARGRWIVAGPSPTTSAGSRRACCAGSVDGAGGHLRPVMC